MLITRSNVCDVDREFLWNGTANLRLRAVRMTILIVYICSWVGVPVGECHRTNFLSNGTVSCCQCSSQNQQSGRCCCARNRVASFRLNCCSTKAKLVETAPRRSAASCCKKSQKSSVNHDPLWPCSSRPSLKSTCDCGAKDMEGLLVCHEPRVLAENVRDIGTPASGRRVCAIEPSYKLGDRQRPPTPPPKSLRR